MDANTMRVLMYSGGGSYFVVGRQVEADSGVGVIGEGAAAPPHQLGGLGDS